MDDADVPGRRVPRLHLWTCAEPELPEPRPPGQDGRDVPVPERGPPRPGHRGGLGGGRVRRVRLSLPERGTRVEQLSEAIDVLRAMWTQSPADYNGVHYQVHGAYCEPRPATPIPILVGGHRPKLVRVAAEKADIWQWMARSPLSGPVSAPGRRVRRRGPGPRRRPPLDAGEAYFPVDPAMFPVPTRMAITEAQDPSGSYANEIDWGDGSTPGGCDRPAPTADRPRGDPRHGLTSTTGDRSTSSPAT